MVAMFFLQLFLVSSFTSQIGLAVHHARSPPESSSKISVAGVVYCDICATNSFSRSSYLLPGVDVHIQCKFKAKSSKTIRQITSISINKTTDNYGVYKLEIPSFEGEDCDEIHKRHSLGSFCKARLLRNNFSSSTCNVLGSKTSAEVFSKSKHGNHCLYSLEALNYTPSKINISHCSDKREFANSFNVSKTFFPFFPPYVFPWHPFPTFPFPPLPPLPQFPFPPFPFPPFPFPLPPPPPRPQPPLPRPPPPSLPFPFPPLPPYPPPPPALAFDPRDPRTWTPYFHFFTPPPPAPPFDPRNWIPNFPFLSPPPFPPGFDPRDPTTWIPKIPSPPLPPAFDPRDPRTWPPSSPFTPPPILPGFDPRNWIPRFPTLAPPPPLPPLGFDPRDPRTWIPYYPPAPPPKPEYSKP